MARPAFDRTDVEANRVKGGLGYLVFFLPLLTCSDSRYGRFCANQGLLVWITLLLVRFVFWLANLFLGWVPLVGWLVGALGNVALVAVALIALYFTYLACVKGDARELPAVGGFTIIK